MSENEIQQLFEDRLFAAKNLYKISRRIKNDIEAGDAKRIPKRLSQRQNYLDKLRVNDEILQRQTTMQLDKLNEKQLGIVRECGQWLARISEINEKLVQIAQSKKQEMSEKLHRLLNSRKCILSYNRNLNQMPKVGGP